MASKSKPTPADGAFAGFGPDWADFFRELAAHQTKEWFEANRSLYETQVLAPLQALVAALTFAFEVREIPLRGDPKRSVFRLHRDVRFSKDKSPFKTNAGAVLTRDGTKAAPGLLYLHVHPTEPFAALGFYRPEPPRLAAHEPASRAPSSTMDRAATMRPRVFDHAAVDASSGNRRHWRCNNASIATLRMRAYPSWHLPDAHTHKGARKRRLLRPRRPRGSPTA